MSDTNPPGNGELHVEPGQVVGAFVPGLSDTAVAPPPPHMPPGEPAPVSGRAPKPKTNRLFFFLGFIGPFAVAAVPLTSLLPTTSWIFPTSYGLLGAYFAAALVMLLVGRGRGNVRLASFGKGGLWSYAVLLLLTLVAVGTCFVQFANPRP